MFKVLVTLSLSFISSMAFAEPVTFRAFLLSEKAAGTSSCRLNQERSFLHDSMPTKDGQGIFEMFSAEDVTTSEQAVQNQWILKFTNRDIGLTLPNQVMFLKITATQGVLKELKERQSLYSLAISVTKDPACAGQGLGVQIIQDVQTWFE